VVKFWRYKFITKIKTHPLNFFFLSFVPIIRPFVTCQSRNGYTVPDAVNEPFDDSPPSVGDCMNTRGVLHGCADPLVAQIWGGHRPPNIDFFSNSKAEK